MAVTNKWGLFGCCKIISRFWKCVDVSGIGINDENDSQRDIIEN
jgi:hypothetical protein